MADVPTLSRLVVALLLLLPAQARGQGFDAVGTRAAGMGGAFVANADDASAVYWNPGALASGALFSAVIDYSGAKATVDEGPSGRGGSRSGTLIALATPPLGLAYYRLRLTTVSPALASGTRLAETLVTHHTGATLVQSLADGIAVGATLKLVRGVAASEMVPAAELDRALEDADDLVGRASNKFDADVGISATLGTLRAGLTVRNLVNPGFEAPGGERLELERQARAGVALSSPMGWLVALDLDLNAVRGTRGEVRHIAAGSEARLTPRILARAGVRLNTVGDQPGGRAPVVSVGGSFAALASIFLETHATFGSAAGDRGWGLAARVAF